MKTRRLEHEEMEVETFQHQALEVRWPDENFDPTVEPQDGETFLTKVVYERMNCPSVVVKPPENMEIKNCNVPNINNMDEIMDTASQCLHPSKEWKEVQLQEFSAIRDKIIALRCKRILLESTEEKHPTNTDDPEEWHSFCQSTRPLLSVILPINQRSLEKLLEFEVDWIQEVDDEKSFVTNWLGEWVYATLACLHMPLEPDTHSALREIAKLCIQIRNRLNPEDVEKAVPLNLLIVLISTYFRQLDLCKFV